ncbi:MAG: hypothetical protein IPI14_13870 [Polaromonas sp.]|nr:hypothetical protein [Polaromonas sp.]
MLAFSASAPPRKKCLLAQLPVLVDNPSSKGRAATAKLRHGYHAGTTSMRAFGTSTAMPNAHHIVQHVVYFQ